MTRSCHRALTCAAIASKFKKSYFNFRSQIGIGAANSFVENSNIVYDENKNNNIRLYYDLYNVTYLKIYIISSLLFYYIIETQIY